MIRGGIIEKRQIILRRPFSLSGLEVSEGSNIVADILYCVVGPGSLRMTNLSKGDRVSIIGPLGNGFSLPDDTQTAILVAGRMGLGPLLHLAAFLGEHCGNIRIVGFLGARSQADLPFGTTAGAAAEWHIATDDASAGFGGFVTDCLADWLDDTHPPAEKTAIYACGPEPMLAAAAGLSKQYGISCQVSMERMMACGIGLCQSCAVEVKQAPGRSEYKLCCKDGPVFDADQVVFNE